MQKITYAIAALSLAAGLSIPTEAQQRASPHETVSAAIGGKKVTIEYGRPFKKGRDIFGGLVPWNTVWRTGADEATKLTTEGDLMVGSLHVPAGTYSLFTLPTQSGWKIIVNKVADQWGAFKYEESQDLGRADMKTASVSSSVEQFTIAIEPAGGNNATLKLTWDTTEASVGLMMH